MAGLAEMLRDGGGPPQGPGGAPPPGGDSDEPAGAGKMPPEQAVKVMQKFGITPQDLPEVAAAADVLMDAMQGQGGPDQGAPPPGPGGSPPPQGA